MQVCNSLQADNHASTPPLSFLQAWCPSCRPTNSVKALKALSKHWSHYFRKKLKELFYQNTQYGKTKWLLNFISQCSNTIEERWKCPLYTHRQTVWVLSSERSLWSNVKNLSFSARKNKHQNLQNYHIYPHHYHYYQCQLFYLHLSNPISKLLQLRSDLKWILWFCTTDFRFSQAAWLSFAQ